VKPIHNLLAQST